MVALRFRSLLLITSALIFGPSLFTPFHRPSLAGSQHDRTQCLTDL